MAFPPQFLEQIRQRVAVSEIVGRKVELKRRGREFVGLSPFKKERTPSFTVNDDKQFYHCFSTGKHGDIFTFLMETEGLSFHEAVAQLARQIGLPLPAINRQAREQWAQNKKLYEVLSHAAAWFQTQLHTADGSAARSWLASRQIGEAEQQTFGLGYAPAHRQRLVKHLESQGFDVATQETAGISLRYDNAATHQSRFFDRVIFPVHDIQKRVIGFGGRSLRTDVAAKYINSPETRLFQKRAMVYNFAPARPPAFEHKSLIVVEGYMDVIALHKAGLNHVVAPLGTAISEAQISLLWRLAHEPVVCLDGDSAGKLASYRLVERVLPMLRAGYSLRFASLPEGQDPDDVVRAHGSAGFTPIVEAACPLVDMLWAKALDENPYHTPEQQAQLRQALRRHIMSIRDKDISRLYGQAIAKKWLDFFAEPLYNDASGQNNAITKSPILSEGSAPLSSPRASGRMGALRRPRAVSEALRNKQRKLADTPPTQAKLSPWSDREIMIVASLLTHPQLLLNHRTELEHCRLQNEELQNMCNELLVYSDTISGQDGMDAVALQDHLEQAGFAAVVTRLKQSAKTLGLACIKPDTALPDVEAEWLERLRLHHHIYLEMELKAAQQDVSDNLESGAALGRLRAIKDELEQSRSRARWQKLPQ